ncbi:MAG TPA: alpha-2-macroglobulin family protein, partial [Aggregatilineales bacterium]|nr:alpha-2-macroglobulin family protein [Aggregatilineales bacterium]
DDNATLGYYRIVARPDYDPSKLQENGYYSGPEFQRSFNVAEYRVPEFQVKLDAAQKETVQGDTIKVTVNTSFFFGGALDNAHVDWNAQAQDYFFNYTGPSANASYSFYDFNEDEGYSIYEQNNNGQNQIATGSGHTDAQGNFVIQLPATLSKNKNSQTITIEADVTDESGQIIAGTIDVVVHAGEFYIGVSPRDYVGAASKPQTVDFISVGLDSKPRPNTDLNIRVVERKWSSVQTVEPETGRTLWEDKVDEVPLTDGVVTTNADGKASFTFTPPHGGIYKIYATSRDTRANQITSSGFIYIAGPDYVPWRQQNSDRIDLKIDRTSYKVGDTASILIASPFQGEATALITVERGDILKTEVMKLPNNSTVYSLPITADMAPNAFVSVMIVKGVDDKNPIASFRMGLVQFEVETDRLNLKITVTPDKPQAGPRETVNYAIHVTDSADKPVQAEIGVGLTDLAVLSLLPDTSTPILDYYYSKVGLAVRTASSLTISVDEQTQEIQSTIKGGGGGGPDTGIFQVRQRFVDTPLWQPNVVTDANGDAKVTVTLPDNLTTWRLDARAVTLASNDLKTTLVGQTTTDLISTKPLLIRPITPRFYVVGDTSTLSAIVNNNTGADQDVTVKIDLKGATLTGDATKTAKIGAQQRLRFDWPVTVDDTDKVSVTFFANSNDNKYTDAAKSAVGQGDDKTLPIVRYEVPETTGTGGTIGPDGGVQVEGVVLPRRFTVKQGSLDVRLDRSLAASATDALNVVENSPYQSTEWTISVMMPNLATYNALKKLGLDNPKLKDSVTQEVNYGIQRLYADQHSDGGWGWFIEDKSDPVVTAYVLIGLNAASKSGFDVDKTVISDGVKYLRGHIPALGDQAATWQLNRASFIFYALAQVGAGDVGSANRLFGIREKMSIYARAYLALTYRKLQPSSANISTLLSDIQNRAIASATGQHWEEDFQDWWNWNSDTRTTAIVLDTLVQIQPTNPLIPNVVRWLMVARKADAWETTQETAWAVTALSDYMQTTGELKPDYSFDTQINDKPLGTTQTASPENVQQAVKLKVAVTDLLTDQVNRLKVNRTGGAGMLYYTA